MATDREKRIQMRAYEIWEREGRPEGREQAHWHQAAQEIDEEGRYSQEQASTAGENPFAQPGGGAIGGSEQAPGAGRRNSGGNRRSPAGTAEGVKRTRRPKQDEGI